jgi:hypothetical protein
MPAARYSIRLLDRERRRALLGDLPERMRTIEARLELSSRAHRSSNRRVAPTDPGARRLPQMLTQPNELLQ